MSTFYSIFFNYTLKKAMATLNGLYDLEEFLIYFLKLIIIQLEHILL